MRRSVSGRSLLFLACLSLLVFAPTLLVHASEGQCGASSQDGNCAAAAGSTPAAAADSAPDSAAAAFSGDEYEDVELEAGEEEDVLEDDEDDFTFTDDELASDSEVQATPGIDVVTSIEEAKEYVQKHPYVVVDFTSTGRCAQCPEYDQHLASVVPKLQKVYEALKFVKFDTHEETPGVLNRNFGLEGVPSLVFYENGLNLTQLPGSGDGEQIEKWLHKATGALVLEMESLALLDELKASRRMGVIGYFPEESPVVAPFMLVARMFVDGDYEEAGVQVTFAVLNDAELAAQLGLTQTGQVALVNDVGLEPRRVVLEPQQVSNTTTFDRMIRSERLPLLVDVDDDTCMLVPEGKEVTLVAKAKDLRRESKVYKNYLAVAKEFREFVFVVYNTDKKDQDRCSYYSGRKFINATEAPYVSALRMHVRNESKGEEQGTQFRVPDGSLGAKSLRKFLNDILDKKAKPFYRSAPLVEKKDSNIWVVVGSNFEEIVLDPEYEVILGVCGDDGSLPRCINIEAALNTMANQANDSGIYHLRVAKMELVVNEHPKVDMWETRAFTFWPKGKNKIPVAYANDDSDVVARSLWRWARNISSVTFRAPSTNGQEDWNWIPDARWSLQDTATLLADTLHHARQFTYHAATVLDPSLPASNYTNRMAMTLADEKTIPVNDGVEQAGRQLADCARQIEADLDHLVRQAELLRNELKTLRSHMREMLSEEPTHINEMWAVDAQLALKRCSPINEVKHATQLNPEAQREYDRQNS